MDRPSTDLAPEVGERPDGRVACCGHGGEVVTGSGQADGSRLSVGVSGVDQVVGSAADVPGQFGSVTSESASSVSRAFTIASTLVIAAAFEVAVTGTVGAFCSPAGQPGTGGMVCAISSVAESSSA